ncbi:MAG: DUF4446 family protein [bacterium]
MCYNFFYYIISFIAIVLIGILIGLVIHLHLKLKKFLAGSDVKNLDGTISEMKKSINDLQIFKKELESYLVSVEARIRRSVQSVSTVRFNPFKGTGSGGNQSFATAFMNEEGDGVVVSSLYSREHVSVFSKPIKAHKAEYELSDEEQNALDAAEKILKAGK